METPSIEIHKSVGDAGPRTSLTVDDVRVLPRTLTKLYEMGYDLSSVIEAVDEIKAEEQRKRSKAEALKAMLTQKAMLSARSTQARRFIIAYWKELLSIASAEGIEYSDGRISINDSTHLCSGIKERESRRSYEQFLERKGYSYHIEYLD